MDYTTKFFQDREEAHVEKWLGGDDLNGQPDTSASPRQGKKARDRGRNDRNHPAYLYAAAAKAEREVRGHDTNSPTHDSMQQEMKKKQKLARKRRK